MHLVAAAAVAGAPVGSRPAAAAPTIEIKAQSRVRLGPVRALGDGLVEVRGALVDALTGEGLGGQRVTVRLGSSATGTAITDESGGFAVELSDVPPGPQAVSVAYAGAGPIDAAAPVTETRDPARAPVAIELTAREVDGGAELTATARTDAGPLDVPIQLEVGPVTGALAPLATARAGAPVLLARARAGGPGAKRVRASYAGDDARDPASAELTVELTTATTTSLAVAATSLAYEDDVIATGRVTDRDGAPVRRAAVTLASPGPTGERRLAQGITGADGSYRFTLEAEVLGAGQAALRVHAVPILEAVRGSSSPPVLITVAAPQPVPVSYTVAAALATALAAGAFFAARTKPWRRLRRPAPPAEAEAGAPEEQLGGGLVPARPSLVSTLRRAWDDGIDGVVRDTVRGRPVAGARVRIAIGALQQERTTGADGAFSFEGLPPGEHRAEAAAAGHVTETFAIAIPHRGELRGARVDLVPVRERAFQLYRRAAEPLLPEARLWGIWSPRQIVDHVRAAGPSPALADLTDFVEEVYFSSRLPPEAILGDAAARVERAIRERAPRAASPRAG